MALSSSRTTTNTTDKVVAYILASLSEEVRDNIDVDDLRDNVEPFIHGLVEGIIEELVGNGVITVSGVAAGIDTVSASIE